MNDWENIARTMWGAIHDWAQARKDSGATLQEIANILGVRNRSVIGEWLNGNKKAEKTSFALLMTYLERAGLDYRDFFPSRDTQNVVSPSPESPNSGNNECRQRIAELEDQVEELKAQIQALEIYKHKWEGHLEAMRAQGSGFVMPTEKKLSA